MILASHLFLTNLNSPLSGIVYQRFDLDKAEGNYPTNLIDHISVSVKRCFFLSFFVSIKQIAVFDFLSFFKVCQKLFLKKIFKFLKILDSFTAFQYSSQLQQKSCRAILNLGGKNTAWHPG